MKMNLEFDVHTFWHAGTGKGAGPDLDAQVFKTLEGLPCLPGRTIRGVIRDAMTVAEDAQALPAGTTLKLFGSPAEGERSDRTVAEEREACLEAARFATKAGVLRFETAEIGRGEDRERWRAWADGHAYERTLLLRRFASTRIDAMGMAADRSLRAVEVAVPMKLHASVEGPDDDTWVAAVKTALPFVEGIGSHRNRGFGRVTIELLAEGS